MDNKKNTILLTVIAVATLLVAVVGATFAYFSAQEGKEGTTTVLVKTGTASSTNFEVSGNISIYADQSNFAENKTSKTGSSTGTVSWTAPGSTQEYEPTEAERTFCYNVSLVVESNNFWYDKAESPTGTAQLLFNVYKGAAGAAETELKTAGDISGLTYVTGISGIETPSEDTESNGDTGSLTTFDGWDITTIAAGTYKIGGNHTIVAPETTGGAEVSAIKDTWTARVTLVNLATEQNYNTNKVFNATLKYDKCSE